MIKLGYLSAFGLTFSERNYRYLRSLATKAHKVLQNNNEANLPLNLNHPE
jgi:hypothetical protein